MLVAEGVLEAWLLLALLVVVYLIPTIVAFSRGVSSPWSVVVVNVLLGWTFVGWVVALAMAARTVNRPAQSERPPA